MSAKKANGNSIIYSVFYEQVRPFAPKLPAPWTPILKKSMTGFRAWFNKNTVKGSEHFKITGLKLTTNKVVISTNADEWYVTDRLDKYMGRQQFEYEGPKNPPPTDDDRGYVLRVELDESSAQGSSKKASSKKASSKKASSKKASSKKASSKKSSSKKASSKKASSKKSSSKKASSKKCTKLRTAVKSAKEKLKQAKEKLKQAKKKLKQAREKLAKCKAEA